jgi:hypothetical protein
VSNSNPASGRKDIMFILLQSYVITVPVVLTRVRRPPMSFSA